MMSKNLIYIVAIEDPNSKVSVNDFFQYAKPTWEHYCKKYDIDLKIATNSGFSAESGMKPIWNKELIREPRFSQYEKIGIVDSDTMIRWDAPNIFELFTENDFCGVNDLCDLDWLTKSINDRQFLFPNVKIDIFKYLNAGVLFFGGKYREEVFGNLLDLYIFRRHVIDAIQGGGKEQTLLNFILQEKNIPITLLNPEWNLLSIHRKNMFTNNWQLNIDVTPHFIKNAYIWHFTGFPIEDRINVMKQTWNFIKQNYI